MNVSAESAFPAARLGRGLIRAVVGCATVVLLALSVPAPAGATGSGDCCVPPPQDLVSWWPGDGNFSDIADANSGTNAGGTTFTTGKVGPAFNFDGAADGYITLTSNPNLLPASDNFTIDAWIKPNFDAENVLDTVLAKRDGCSGAGMSYLLDVIKSEPGGGGHAGRPIGQVNLVMSDQSGVDAIADSGTTVVPNDGQFHHVAGTYDGSLMKVYLDGQPVGLLARSGPILVTGSAVVISHHGGACPQRSAAVLDEVEFYDRALTAAEIQAIFDAGSAGKCKAVAFARFTPKVEIDDDFELKARFRLGAASDGMDPPTEDVSLEIGGFSTTIPAGSFKLKKNGRFKFKGVIDGVELVAAVRPLRGGFQFVANGEGAGLAGIASPVTVRLTIGDDEGSATVTAELD